MYWVRLQTPGVQVIILSAWLSKGVWVIGCLIRWRDAATKIFLSSIIYERAIMSNVIRNAFLRVFVYKRRNGKKRDLSLNPCLREFNTFKVHIACVSLQSFMILQYYRLGAQNHTTLNLQHHPSKSMCQYSPYRTESWGRYLSTWFHWDWGMNQ